MKNIFSLFKPAYCLVLLVILCTCSEEEELTDRPYPRLKTLEVKNINTDGATVAFEFLFRGSNEIEQYGFVWSVREDPALISFADRVLFQGTPGDDGFETRIEKALPPNQRIYVRSFVQTEGITVYGDQVEFVSKGGLLPEILEFNPAEATVGDSLYITGRNFTYLNSGNAVFLDNFEIPIASSSDTLIKAIIPIEYADPEAVVKVKTFGTEVSTTENFFLTTPVLISTNPDSGVEGDTIEIQGNNFSYVNDKNLVRFNDEASVVVSSSKNSLKVIIPKGLSGEYVDITVQTVNQISEKLQFRIKTPLVSDFLPKSGICGTMIRITGENFSSVVENNSVYFGAVPGVIRSATSTEILVSVPSSAMGTSELRVATGGRVTLASDKFEKLSGNPDFPQTNLINYRSFDKAFNAGEPRCGCTGYNSKLTHDMNGCPDQAVAFNGTGGIIYGYPEDIFNIGLYEEFTLSMWISPKYSSLKEKYQPFLEGTFNSPPNYNLLNYSTGVLPSGNIFFNVYNHQYSSVPDKMEIKVNEGWHMVTWVYSNLRLKAFVDGRFVDEKTLEFAIQNGQQGFAVFMGGKKTQSIQRFDDYVGSLDQIRLYDRALSEQEITQMYTFDSCDACK